MRIAVHALLAFRPKPTGITQNSHHLGTASSTLYARFRFIPEPTLTAAFSHDFSATLSALHALGSLTSKTTLITKNSFHEKFLDPF